ncbi:MAG: hypothetical protein H6509_06610 [Bryobacterales bacterium]|nr:hypothetical protein [Bryobacterales bacterium]
MSKHPRSVERFDAITIHRLFGHEAAENEDPSRLKEYYFKTDNFDQVVADLPLRIVVGHKGIGKSALFKIAFTEDSERDDLAIFLKPDDILTITTESADFLGTIRDWKIGLARIISDKVLTNLGATDRGRTEALKRYGGQVVDFLVDTFGGLKPVDFNPGKKKLVERFLSSRRIRVYVDDLDRGWLGRREDVVRISALLNAVRDISSDNRGIQFKIGLRSDVYYLVRTSDESTDKIEGSVVWHSYTNHEIFVLLVKRVATYFGHGISDEDLVSKTQYELSGFLNEIIEKRFWGAGHWKDAPIHRVLMSLIRKRPRDLVKLCTLAARQADADGQRLILSRHLQAVFEEYSQGRIQDTVNEFRSELPDIERLLLNMKPNRRERKAKQGYIYNTAQLLDKIKAIREMGEFTFSSRGHGECQANDQDLAAFMYKINFLTARRQRDDGLIVRKYFEENRYLSSRFANFGFDWEVHPAYRWALQPELGTSVPGSLQLTADD